MGKGEVCAICARIIACAFAFVAQENACADTQKSAPAELQKVSHLTREQKFLKKYPHTIFISDFGALPNDFADDAPAVAAAIKQASKTAGTRIIFEDGVYDFKSLTKAIAAIAVKDVNDIAIDGRNATFVNHSEGSHIAMLNCRNVTITNVQLKSAKEPFAIGKVGAFDKAEGTFECALYAPFTAEKTMVKAVTSYDMERKIFTPDTDIYQTHFRKIAKPKDLWTLRVPLADPTSAPAEGSTVVLRYQVYAPPAIILANSRNITLSNMGISSHAGMGIFACNTENISVVSLKIAPENEANPLSTTADGIHFDNCRGKISITESAFAKNGDDAVNIHQTYWILQEITGPNSLKIKLGKKLTGLIEALTPRRGDIIALGDAQNWLRPSFTSEIVETQIGENAGEVYLTLQDPLPTNTKIGLPVSNASAFPQVNIEKCSFKGNRGRAIVLLTDGATVNDCTFTDIALPAIYMQCDFAKWKEGPAPRDIRITNCTFTNCNHWTLENGAPAIFASAKFPDGAPANDWVGEDIKVEDCTFKDCSETPVLLEYIRNPVFKDGSEE